jgi:protein-S-isoprenylcysteine O-methyltransferase Ste14
MNWASLAFPMSIRWLGLIVGILTVAAVAWVLRSLGDNVSETALTKTKHQLIMTGPYRWVRHPLYTTGITLFLAIGLMQASWLVLSVAGAVAVFIALLVIPAEERALVAKFGNAYRVYAGRTGRLLPQIRSSAHRPDIG